ncbi:MAG: hypothetical protein VB013_06260 [Anaerolineaceae bacterium]|nr:hypothetical protein [Anaerolineaceae bacterium]
MFDQDKPDEMMLRSIRSRMDSKETDELLEIYADHDTESWIPATFDIIKELLLARGFELSELLSLTHERAAALAQTHASEEEEDEETSEDEYVEDDEEEDDLIEDALSRSIRQAMNNKEDDELIHILADSKPGEWVPGTFKIIHEILEKRGVIETNEDAIALVNEGKLAEEVNYAPGDYINSKRYFTHPVTKEDHAKAGRFLEMNQQSTEDLLNLYATHDEENWPDFTFDVVRDILIDRGWPADEVDNLILETPAEDEWDSEDEEE